MASIKYYPPARPGPPAWLLLAHGAGGNQSSPWMVQMAEALAARGLSTATFNFRYADRGRRVPDPPAVLEATWLEALQAVAGQAEGQAVVIGGKSMGGRIATQLAAARDLAPLGVAGLVLLGYPLHPPGKPEQLRTAHWPQVRLPALFVQGTRDTFGTSDELAAALPKYAGRADVHLVEGGDHSFKVTRKPAGTQEQIFAAIHERIVGWVAELTK